MQSLAKTIFKFDYYLLNFLRLVFGFVILYLPIIGWLFSWILDAIDYAYALRGNIVFATYNEIDKLVDIWFRLFMALAPYKLDWEYKEIFLILFILRSIGDILFFLFKKEEVFLFFPNILEFFFIGFALQLQFNFLKFSSFTNMLIILIVSTILKLIQEYFGHVVKITDPFNKGYLQDHPELGR